ncbi:MAG TPA: Rrf2 family transcriptional regulator [Terriglobales bacterium]|nr:Rrf2 family transcriptional regulator [Terriglobales bacterium]
MRFGVAVHVLVMLALEEGARTSTGIAASVNTNPVVIRRILGLLQAAGLVRGHTGAGGGFELARWPENVSLAQVFRAVEADGPAPPAHRPNRKCPVGRHVSAVLASIGTQAERAFLASLARHTLADAVARVRREAGAELS